MDRLEAMTILLAAVETGSLSAASRQLRIPLATVSRRMLELEEHLGVRLLLRGHRKLSLTDAGRAYVNSCRDIMEYIAEAERTAAGEYQAPQGDLTVSIPVIMGRVDAIPVIVEFLRAHTGIRVHVQITDRFVNLQEEHVDVALRVGELPDSSMIATRVGLIRRVLCASPAYLKRQGVPKNLADLRAHDCVTYDGYAAGNNWEFLQRGDRQKVRIPARLTVNTGEGAVVAGLAGAGIVRVLYSQVADHVKAGKLTVLLDAHEPAPWPVSLIHPSQNRVPLKLRAFLDFAVPRLRKRLGYEESRLA